MAVLLMKKLHICALKKDKKPLLEYLQKKGLLEIESIETAEGFFASNSTEKRLLLEKQIKDAETALSILQSYSDKKVSLFASLEGKEEIELTKFREVSDKSEDIKSTIQRVLDLQTALIENKAKIQQEGDKKEVLKPWKGLDIPASITKTSKTSVVLGSLPGEFSHEDICFKLSSELKEDTPFYLETVFQDKMQTCIALVLLSEHEKTAENILRDIGFSRISLNTSLMPCEEIENIDKKIQTFEKEIQSIEEELRKISDQIKNIQILCDNYRIRAERYEVSDKTLESENTFLLSGYIPNKNAEKIATELENKFICFVDITEPDENDNVPVALENGIVASSFEGVLESYGLPKKGELDPSKMMSIFYIFLFGLMLSDAAYGLLISIVCFAALKKFPKMGEGLRKALRMYMYCGLSTLFWGIMFGGYFGDAVDVIAKTFFGVQIPEGGLIKPLWFAPINDPMKLLLYSLLFGLIHLFAGLGMKGYTLLKDKNYKEFFADVLLWFFFLTGLVGIFIPTQMFASIAGFIVAFPSWLNMLCKILAIGGAVGILLTAGGGRKNKILSLALGAYSLYGVTSWLSDLLSYSRLLALGLATGVIAQVVNSMGSMFGGGILGAVIFSVVFIIGHTFNMAINLLGAYVHTNRLQYVEFFGKFYEGGGRAFSPFKQNTKYVDIKEEKTL